MREVWDRNGWDGWIRDGDGQKHGDEGGDGSQLIGPNKLFSPQDGLLLGLNMEFMIVAFLVTVEPYVCYSHLPTSHVAEGFYAFCCLPFCLEPSS